jgi:hypothetical protein
MKLTSIIKLAAASIAGLLTLWLAALGLEYGINGPIYMSKPPSINPLTIYFKNEGQITRPMQIIVLTIKVTEVLPDGRFVYEKHYYTDSVKISSQLPLAWNFKQAETFFVYPRPDSIPLYALKIKWKSDSFLPDIIPYISDTSDSLWNIYNNGMRRWEGAVINQQPFLEKVIETIEGKRR